MHALIDSEYARQFAAEAKAAGIPHVEEKTIHLARSFAVGDRAAAAGQAQEFEIFDGTSKSLVERTQNPVITDSATLPPELRVALCAINAVVRLGNLGTITQAKEMQADLDRTILTLRFGGVEHVQIAAPEFLDYGPAMLVGNDGAASPLAGRDPSGPRTWRKLALPRRPGVQQQLSLKHAVGRSTDWPVSFVADYYMPALIARKTV